VTTIDANGAAHGPNGQYVHNPHAAPGYDLTIDDATYNARGSASFPPAPRSAEQHIAFWNTVEIPDWMLKNARDTYTVWQIERLKEDADAAAKQLRRDNPGKAYVNGKLMRDAISDVVDKTFIDSAVSKYPDMHRQYTRDIVRGCLMWYYAGELPAEESHAVLDYKVKVGPSSVPTSDLIKWFHFHAWQDSITG